MPHRTTKKAQEKAKTPASVSPGPFKSVSSRASFPRMEEAVFQLWRQRDVFRRSVQRRQGAPKFILFEGPPTANGSPGIHHVLARVFKDLFPRYKTMKGFQAPRKGGWDTHGLPVELEVEKELKLASKAAIEDYGIERFNQKCRESVFRYVHDWEAMTERVAFWVDMTNAYVTYANSYIETCWWIVKQLWDAGLVYHGRRVAPHCPRCETTLSSHEVALGYEENTPDPSIYVKFKLAAPQLAHKAFTPFVDNRTYLLAWTTTPWTLPGNTALAVNPKETYVLARLTQSSEQLILARALLDKALHDDHTVVADFPGSELVGLRYEPLYNPDKYGLKIEGFQGRAIVGPIPGFSEPKAVSNARDKSWHVYLADFVSMEDGTGIVHIAPAFGEDDFNLGAQHGLLLVQPVAPNGTLEDNGDKNSKLPGAGRFVKKADPMIMDDLKSRGLLYRRETIKHTYPFCWRCDTPLLYYAKSSWYLRTTAVKERLIEANRAIGWHPEHIRDGRFGEWLAGNIDWAISRERFWGTPWPVWTCEKCGHAEAIGGVAELRARPGVQGLAEPLDLHRPCVDAVTFACTCGATMRRVPEVMDAWFDSGAMPFAQWHYPFENAGLIDSGAWYPADFICEAIDQTRGWFYSLHAVATLLEAATRGKIKAPSYRSVISVGLILDATGEKMSKSRGNIVQPWDVINAHGADAVRWYLYSATPPGNSRRFSQQLVADVVRTFLLTLWNTYSFFVTYANIDGFKPADGPARSTVGLDRWALSRLHTLIGEVTESLETYDPTTAARKIEAFVDDLSNWYVRRSRRRFWKTANDADKRSAYTTLYECLVTLSKLLAPFTPFLAEEMYQNLVRSVDPAAPDSVHLTDYPEADASRVDKDLERDVAAVINAVSLGRAARQKAKVRVRQPLQKVVMAAAAAGDREAIARNKADILEELNVKEMAFTEAETDVVEYRVKGNPAALGPKYGAEMGRVMGAIAKADARQVASRARAGAPVEIDSYTLQPQELDVATEDRPGFATAADARLTVAVTTKVTPELALEGLARELVHRIQNMRRAAGFEIADRIVTSYETDDATARAFERHGDYIRQETLSVRLVRGPAPDGAYVEAQKVEGADVRIGVMRVRGSPYA